LVEKRAELNSEASQLLHCQARLASEKFKGEFFHVTHSPEFASQAGYTLVLRKMRDMKTPFEYGGVVSGNAFCNREIASCVPSSKPRTTDLRPWL